MPRWIIATKLSRAGRRNGLRIIAGKFGSQPLIAPKGRDIRPTSDRLREALFNVLAPHLEDAIFVDMFAGTGAVGLEAVSRGAQHVYFAEHSKPALDVLRRNVANLQVGPQVTIDALGSLHLLRNLVKQQVTPSIVFLDPPYNDAASYQETLTFLGIGPWLASESMVVAEHSSRIPLLPQFGHLKRYRVLKQGEASLSFFAAFQPDTKQDKRGILNHFSAPEVTLE
ncbi:MAG: 16S rRNA (guanine(966)-N(2))-methyltransferase RsmD [Acidobacteriaceae bacterium]